MDLGIPDFQTWLSSVMPILEPFGQWFQMVAAVSLSSLLLSRIKRVAGAEKAEGKS